MSACPLLIVSLLLSQGCWRTSYSALSPADCSSWPSVSRGVNTLVISQRAQQPLSYLPPLLTNILLSSDFSCQASSSGVRRSSCVLRDMSAVSGRSCPPAERLVSPLVSSPWLSCCVLAGRRLRWCLSCWRS